MIECKGFHEQEASPIVRNVKVGDIITSKVKDEEDRHYTRQQSYKVLDVFPHIVRAVSTRDSKDIRCFSYGDLIMMGIEHQAQEIEAKRRIQLEENMGAKYA